MFNLSSALIHGPNIPGSYAVLFFTASDFTAITCHIHTWALFSLWLRAPSFFLELFLHSLVAYWAPTDLASSSFSVISFCLFILFMATHTMKQYSAIKRNELLIHTMTWINLRVIIPHEKLMPKSIHCHSFSIIFLK